jgi:hypothetical protein
VKKAFESGGEYMKTLKTVSIIGAFVVGAFTQFSTSKQAQAGQDMSFHTYEALRKEIEALWSLHHTRCEFLDSVPTDNRSPSVETHLPAANNAAPRKRRPRGSPAPEPLLDDEVDEIVTESSDQAAEEEVAVSAEVQLDGSLRIVSDRSELQGRAPLPHPDAFFRKVRDE